MLTGEHGCPGRLTKEKNNLAVLLVHWCAPCGENFWKIIEWTWLFRHPSTLSWPSFHSLLSAQHPPATFRSPMCGVTWFYGSFSTFLPPLDTL